MGLLGKLTGTDLSQEVAEFAELYGETLVGMHADLETQQLRFQAQCTDALSRVNFVADDVRQSGEEYLDKLRSELKQAQEAYGVLDHRLGEVCSALDGTKADMRQARAQLDKAVQGARDALSQAHARMEEFFRKAEHTLSERIQHAEARLCSAVQETRDSLEKQQTALNQEISSALSKIGARFEVDRQQHARRVEETIARTAISVDTMLGDLRRRTSRILWACLGAVCSSIVILAGTVIWLMN